MYKSEDNSYGNIRETERRENTNGRIIMKQ